MRAFDKTPLEMRFVKKPALRWVALNWDAPMRRHRQLPAATCSAPCRLPANSILLGFGASIIGTHPNLATENDKSKSASSSIMASMLTQTILFSDAHVVVKRVMMLSVNFWHYFVCSRQPRYIQCLAARGYIENYRRHNPRVIHLLETR